MRTDEEDEEAAPAGQQVREEEQDDDDEDLPVDNQVSELDKASAAAVRLNAIVGAASFLSSADPISKEKMVLIVKKEFKEFSGYVSIHLNNTSHGQQVDQQIERVCQ